MNGPASHLRAWSRCSTASCEGRADIVDELDDEARWPKVLTLGVHAPADATFERVLTYLAAMAHAGVRCVLPGIDEGSPETSIPNGPAADGPLAVDLGPAPQIAFGVHAVPPAPAGVVDRIVGCPTPPNTATPKAFPHGTGGRFGQRGARQRRARKRGEDSPPDPIDTSIDAAFDWLAAAQRKDGAFGDDHGMPNVEATALVTLALLADGIRMRGEPRSEMLARSVGWLMEQQRDDGSLAAPGPDCVRRHALATHALAEAFGLDPAPEVRGALRDANTWLAAHRCVDGGFACDPLATRSDVATSAVATLALSTCEFFGVRPPDEHDDVTSRSLGAWLAEHEHARTERHEASALFARSFAGRAPARGPERDETVARLVRELDTTDPWTLMWTTHCVYQIGHGQWPELRHRLADVARRQPTTGDLAGSWPPSAGFCRATTTALDVLALLTPSRYARLLR